MGKDVLNVGTRNILEILVLNYMIKKSREIVDNQCVVLLSSTHFEEERWLMDSRATNHMTYCSNDFTNSTTSRKTHITNANGLSYPVVGDILTKEIIRRGTKRGGLYYMDDFNSRKINIVQHIDGPK
ncbi:hypothetical protein CR513_15758, partial [Mucuna pruriens]